MIKRMLVLTVALLMVFPAITSAKKVPNLNIAPLMQVPHRGISSAENLRNLVEKYQDRIKDGFEQANLGQCFQDFMEQVKTTEIREIIIPKGQNFQWMLFYSRIHKKVTLLSDAEWSGNRTFEAFAFTIKCEYNEYEFIVPKICGNLSLMGTKNPLPACKVDASPERALIGEPIKVDVSGSRNATNYEVTVSLNGKDVDFKKLAEGTTQCEFRFKEPGEYTVSVKAFNSEGIASQNECTDRFILEKAKDIPPSCNLVVTPTEGYVGQIYKLDATGSSDKDGSVVKAEFTLTGKETETKAVSGTLLWDKKITRSGIYSASVQVTDNDGLVSSNNCSVSPIRVQKRMYMLFDIGPMVAKGTYTGYVFGRLGFCYLIVPEKWDVTLSAGYAVKLAGHAFKNHFLSNLLLNYHMSDFYIGAGIGYSSKVRIITPGYPVEWKACFNIVGNIGYDIFKSFNSRGSIFAEVRLPIVKGLKLKEAHEILLGFRFLF